MKNTTLIVLVLAACASIAVAALLAFLLLKGKRKSPPSPPTGGGGGNSSPGSRTGALVATLQGGTVTVNIRKGMGAGGKHALNKDFGKGNFPIDDGAVVGFDINFAPGYEWGCKGKIGGLQIGSGKASGGDYSTNGATHRMMWDKGGGAYAYVYIPQGTGDRQPSQLSSPGEYGQSVWKSDFSGILKTDTWHRVELGVKLNTPGKSDGRMFMRIDGVERTLNNVYWRTSGGMDITAFGIGIFHGGPCKAEKDSTLYIRNMQLFKWKD